MKPQELIDRALAGAALARTTADYAARHNADPKHTHLYTITSRHRLLRAWHDVVALTLPCN